MAVDTWKGAQPYKYSVFSIWSDDDDDDLHFYTIIFQATCKLVQSHEQKDQYQYLGNWPPTPPLTQH